MEVGVQAQEEEDTKSVTTQNDAVKHWGSLRTNLGGHAWADLSDLVGRLAIDDPLTTRAERHHGHQHWRGCHQPLPVGAQPL
jgi:2-phospho-L-lactate transferase/gluconeogenesis factor (CofD/UPF0052 family)